MADDITQSKRSGAWQAVAGITNTTAAGAALGGPIGAAVGMAVGALAEYEKGKRSAAVHRPTNSRARPLAL